VQVEFTLAMAEQDHALRHTVPAPARQIIAGYGGPGGNIAILGAVGFRGLAP
jgi:hypothetical protein